MTKLFRELNESVEYMIEEKEGKKHLYLEGTALQSGIKNRNGRIYPPELMDREANRYIEESVKRGNAFGEFGHPNGPKLNETLISHRIVNLRKDGNDWIGKAVVLDEGSGKLIRSIVETGGKLGVSSRGLGSVKHDAKLGADIVQDDFRIVVGYDVVTNPSAPGAWVNGLMENTIDWKLNEKGEWIAEVADNIRKEVKTLSKRELQEKQLSLFEHFLSELAKPSHK
jgi:hypothetical protein